MASQIDGSSWANPELIFGMTTVEHLDHRDLALLDDSVRRDYTGVSTTDLLRLVDANQVQFWKLIDGARRAVVITRINQLSSGRELFIWHMAGNKGTLTGQGS